MSQPREVVDLMEYKVVRNKLETVISVIVTASYPILSLTE